MTNDQFDIEVAEDTLRAAMLGSDVTALDRLIADDLLFIGPDGSVLAKDDDLALHRSGEQRMTALHVHERCIRVSGSVGTVSVMAHVAGFYKGQAFDGRFRYLRVWQKTATGWSVIAGSVFALH